jgi:hypothetical protein
VKQGLGGAWNRARTRTLKAAVRVESQSGRGSKGKTILVLVAMRLVQELPFGRQGTTHSEAMAFTMHWDHFLVVTET